MARVIRDQWVWKRRNRWWRFLPRRDDGHPKMSWEDEDIYEQISTFPSPMQISPPKLWVAWIYRDFYHQGSQIRDQIIKLFGDDAKPGWIIKLLKYLLNSGEMQVFKNTTSTNIQLWKIKHLIEIRPMIFPNGEPKLTDIQNVEVLSDGRCIINECVSNLTDVKLFDKRKHFDEKYMSSFLKSRDWGTKDVYEDNVYNPANISIID